LRGRGVCGVTTIREITFVYIEKKIFKAHCIRKIQLDMKASEHCAESTLRKSGRLGP
jgi:hypothetical protein